MSAIPAALKCADEYDLLASLSGLLRANAITAAQARSVYAAWKVERSSDAETYATYEITRHWRRA